MKNQSNDEVERPMITESPSEIFLEGVARGTERFLADEQFTDRLAEKVAEKIALRFEVLTPKAAAALLEVTERTLGGTVPGHEEPWHVEHGLDKSIALGTTNPRYFLSQVHEHLKSKVIKGRGNADRGMRISERRAA